MSLHILISYCLFLIVSGSYPLNTSECSPPKSLGGQGTCGPAFCYSVSTTKPKCVFSQQAYNYPLLLSKTTCRPCTQSIDSRSYIVIT